MKRYFFALFVLVLFTVVISYYGVDDSSVVDSSFQDPLERLVALGYLDYAPEPSDPEVRGVVKYDRNLVVFSGLIPPGRQYLVVAPQLGV
jgi:hypothetical protein